MNNIILAVMGLVLAACTQPLTPPADSTTPDSKSQTTTGTGAAATSGAASENPQATTPILSVLVGSSVSATVKGMWCLQDGTAPFTKISAQDESIAAPMENQTAPPPGSASTTKDTATRQAPGVATVDGRPASDSQFHIKWLSGGLRGEADISLHGDTLTFSDESGRATFTRCP